MEPDKKNPQQIRKRRLFIMLLAFIVGLVATALLSLKAILPRHPRFGPIYEASAFDLNEARSNRIGIFLRKHLPRRVVQSPYFPSRYKDQPRYLDLKGTRLEWSIGGTNSGWLYFWDVDTRSGSHSKWEFAPCSKTNLLSVTNLPDEFYGSLNPRIVEVFDDSSTTNAIKVSVGQILFARRTDETNRVYLLRLSEQDGNKLVAHYCVASP